MKATSFIRTLALTAALSLSATVATAMDAVQTVEREVTVTQEDGTTKLVRESAALVRPGDRIVYTINFVNTSGEAATDMTMAMPVPAEVRFLEGSADVDGKSVLYSADGGSTFADRTALTVANADGSRRAAGSDDITHVQWTIQGDLVAGAAGSVSFKGDLR